MNNAIKFLIVEDDPVLSVDLEMMLDELGYQVVGKSDNSADALDIIFSDNPDMILMDIDIKGKLKGTDIAQKTKHLGIPVIFITGHNDKDAFHAAQQGNMSGYLVKPVNELTLQSTISTTLRNMELRKPTSTQVETREREVVSLTEGAIFLKKKSSYHKVRFTDIQCIAADGRYTLICVGQDKYISKYTLTEFINLADSKDFVKVHRGHVVNINHVVSYDPNDSTILLQSGREVPLSRGYKDEFLELIRLG